MGVLNKLFGEKRSWFKLNTEGIHAIQNGLYFESIKPLKLAIKVANRKGDAKRRASPMVPAIEFEQKRASSHINLAIAFYKMGNFGKADESFYKAISVIDIYGFPQRPRFCELASEFYFRIGDIDLAHMRRQKAEDFTGEPEEVGEYIVSSEILHELHEKLNASTDLERYSSDGDTILGYACQVGDIDNVRRLLDAGADPNQRMFTDNGQLNCTPLMRAAFYGHQEIVELLLSAGADRSDTDAKGYTAQRYLPDRIKGKFPTKLYQILDKWQPLPSQEDEAMLIDELMVELINIGRTPKIANPEKDEAFFWRPRGEGVGPNDQWDSRTREIGKKLYQMGNDRLDYMKSVHEGVVKVLGPLAGHALSAHWHRIGEEEPNGEVWFQ